MHGCAAPLGRPVDPLVNMIELAEPAAMLGSAGRVGPGHTFRQLQDLVEAL